MPRFRIGFLPAFFTVLGIVFCVALYLRVRSYENQPPRGSAASAAGEQGAGTSRPRAGQPGGDSPVALVDYQPRMMAAPVFSDAARLRQPPPGAMAEVSGRQTTPAPAAQEVPKPSLISRIVNPIARAIGVERKPATRIESASSIPTRASEGSAPSEREPIRNDDKTSDTVPPQLVSVEFVPAQVRDGEETMMVVVAQDDLSGIRSISGTIAAPSGAVQGFACQREADTPRYVARIAIPKDAAEGVWRVNYLSMIDNASNTMTYSTSTGLLPATASFRVTSSRPDTQGPTLNAVWIDKRSIKAGEKNIINVQAEDDKAGVNLVSGVFQSPSRYARVGFVCRNSSGANWSCEFTAPACGDCGEWQLEQVQLQDKANNMTTVRGDNQLVSAVMMDITSDHCDNTPPGLQSVVLDRDVVRSTEESVVTVTINLSDDVCGVLSVSGQATGPNTSGVPPRLYASFTAAGDQQTWVARFIVPRLAAKGLWRLTWIQVLDRGHNLKTYSTADPVLSRAAFNVE